MLWRMRGEDSRTVTREHMGGVEAIERDARTRCSAEAAALADGEQLRVCEVRNARDRTFSEVRRADRLDRVLRWGGARAAQVQGMQTVRDHEAGAARACLAGHLQAPVGARYPKHLCTTRRDMSREVMTFLGSALWMSGWVWGQTQTFWRLSLSMAPVSRVRTSENGSSTLRDGICGTVSKHTHAGATRSDDVAQDTDRTQR